MRWPNAHRSGRRKGPHRSGAGTCRFAASHSSDERVSATPHLLAGRSGAPDRSRRRRQAAASPRQSTSARRRFAGCGGGCPTHRHKGARRHLGASVRRHVRFPFAELDPALREMCLRSAPGLGALHCEALHQLHLAACKELAAAFNRSIGDGGAPASREVGIAIVPLLKPGKPGK
ncbi:Tcoingi protein [Trypanosoma conorhini]|uniref:Tcoingi protein n=1 Tax=Trypanosoma conorhini TaxID=83891 RepID=A0A422MUU6_9TRYP|nr:Tcoingi protein [Trypanosoma conorhini]RNE96977.1 Tcoingi protein [Trypanosoma conorhini]